MGRDLVCARHFPDQSDRLRDALRSGKRGIRRLRRVFHRHSTAARRIVPPLAAVGDAVSVPTKKDGKLTAFPTILCLGQEGWVTEWSIVHAWKACVLKGTEGSNPSPSASSQAQLFQTRGLVLFVRAMEIRTPFDRWGA